MQKRTFAECDAAIEVAFDNRQRYPDDEELDNLSMNLAYLQGIEESGWTQAEYEYRYLRSLPTDGDVPQEENENVESEHQQHQHPPPHPHQDHASAQPLGCSEAGEWGEVGLDEGLSGSLCLHDPQDCP
jgi:hypothetical protein